MRVDLSICSPVQVKMARASLGWSVFVLSEYSKVSVSTVKRMETSDGFTAATPANLKLIRETLEAAGIEFIGTAEDGPGVRLWSLDTIR